MNIEYKETPWPHFVGSLDEEMYDYAHKWSTDENLSHTIYLKIDLI